MDSASLARSHPLLPLPFPFSPLYLSVYVKKDAGVPGVVEARAEVLAADGAARDASAHGRPGMVRAWRGDRWDEMGLACGRRLLEAGEGEASARPFPFPSPADGRGGEGKKAGREGGRSRPTDGRGGDEGARRGSLIHNPPTPRQKHTPRHDDDDDDDRRSVQTRKLADHVAFLTNSVVLVPDLYRGEDPRASTAGVRGSTREKTGCSAVRRMD